MSFKITLPKIFKIDFFLLYINSLPVISTPSFEVIFTPPVAWVTLPLSNTFISDDSITKSSAFAVKLQKIKNTIKKFKILFFINSNNKNKAK